MNKFAPAGFFVLRTPLLPFDDLLSWTHGSEDEFLSLEEKLAGDQARFRARLLEIVSRPEVREALFVASPHLEESLDYWVREPESERAQGIEHALLRYVARMAGRATPFGLCAGCSVGRLGPETRLGVEGTAKCRRHTRLSMDYLVALTEALRNDRTLRSAFEYRLNSSLYRTAGAVRYVASRLIDKALSYHLVVVENTDYLAATLDRATDGAPFEELASALIDEEVTPEEAAEYIHELIDSEILVADISLPVTGDEPAGPLIRQLHRNPGTAHIAQRLEQVRAELADMDALGLGVPPSRYRRVAHLLEDLPAEIELAHLFEVDLIRPAPNAALGTAVLAEITRAVSLLYRPTGSGESRELAQFQAAFLERYGRREVPILEALDEEIGVGFGRTSDATPLGLHFPARTEPSATWGARETVLMRKWGEALQAGAEEIVLTRGDLEEMSATGPPSVPGSFAVMATIVASSGTALAQGDFRVVVDGASGPPGARWLARFCLSDDELRRHVEEHVRAEQALEPDAVFAEIIHLPRGQTGGLFCRPVLRAHEIPYLGSPGVGPARQIGLSDLTLSVRDGRIILRSVRLGCEVIPRNTNAHNYRRSGLGVYEFLCALQGQGVEEDVIWDWGTLMRAPFLPRVVTGRLILRRAQWQVGKEELKRLGHARGGALFQEVQAWRQERRLPRWVNLADGDNLLPVDLDHVSSVEMFAQLVRSRDRATLIELFPGPDELCVCGPEGRFVHEVIIPFVGPSRTVESPGGQEGQVLRSKCRLDSPVRVSSSAAPRTFPPGSEWLYAKLYTGAVTADAVLCETVTPLVRSVLESGAADQWFFIRYADPHWHLRLRFHGNPERLHGEVLPALEAAISPLVDDGRVRRLQLDTYEREMERYGGPEGIALAEKLFQTDSDAVLAMLALLEPGDDGMDERWRLTLRGMDAFLTDFGFDCHKKYLLFRKMPAGLAEVAGDDPVLKSEISRKFREERSSLETLLDPALDAENPLSPALEILHRRSDRVISIVSDLGAVARAGRLQVPLEDVVLSCVHLHANRLLRSAHREQEWVIHDFLSRLYRSRTARAETGS